MKKLKIFFCGLSFFCSFSQLQAQETIAITGGNASGTGGSVSYTLGQVAYVTQSGDNKTVSEGVQQAFEISVLAIASVEGLNIDLIAFPNPTTDLLQLKIEKYIPEQAVYELYSLNGRLLQSQKLNGTEATIDMRQYATAVYILKVLDNNKVLKTFQIIKK